MPLDFMGVGFRADRVMPNLDNGDLDFSVFSPRLILRTAFVTHEQILFQYSRYWYETPAAGQGMFPYNQQVGRRHVPDRRQERVPGRGDHLVLTPITNEDDDA